ncbi:MAG: hypothetical protein HY882_13590 [Deltaproteobacteria bacterium]|nr:hypothetical protein [Deltaproteobacteria bacterium]
MVFTLEALEAKHGDALLLHYGEVGSPRLIVIDGGPRGVYKNVLKKRLDKIKQKRTPNERLPIRMVLVSHIDEDHISGILDLSQDLVDAQEDNQDLPYDIQGLWHNSFDDILGNQPEELFATLKTAAASAAATGTMPTDLYLSFHGALMVASVPQGRDLRNNANALNLAVNAPFNGLVMAPKQGEKTVPLGGGLSFTILSPNQQRLEDLQEEWDKQLPKIKKAKPAEAQSITAAFVDDSVYNLSSIILLATAGNRRMLLTGDARGDDIIAGLKTAGLFQGDRFHADLFKVPHHGSDRNISTEFFRQVTANHYVISGDGKYGNPEIATLKMLTEARGQDKYTIYFTNQEARLVEFFNNEPAPGKNYQVVFRQDSSSSIPINLEEAID